VSSACPGRRAERIEAVAGPGIRVTMADTGTGVTPEHLERVFELFDIPKPQGKGTGRRLSTGDGLIRLHAEGRLE